MKVGEGAEHKGRRCRVSVSSIIVVAEFPSLALFSHGSEYHGSEVIGH